MDRINGTGWRSAAVRVSAGVIASMVLLGALWIGFRPNRSAGDAEQPQSSHDSTGATIADARNAAFSPPATAERPRMVPVPRKRPEPRNEIRNFRAVSLSGQEMQVTVDYAYVGDHGGQDVFMHAVALQSDEWVSRVPGTSFPEAPIDVGDGSVTITIRKVVETGAAASAKVKVCMVSIRSRSAFVCKTFDYAKEWE